MRKANKRAKRIRNVLMLLGSYDHRTHQGIARVARERQWHLDVSVLKNFQLPRRWRGDGIITSLNNSRSLEQFILRQKVPVVDLSSWREDLLLPRVTTDNGAMGRLAAEHFLSLGHRHFAWFALSQNPVGRRRMEGFRHRLARQGLSVIRLDGSGAQDAKTVMKRLRELPVPCAVFAKSDYDAAWVSRVIREADLRIPDELAVLGVDNNPLICECVPTPLSSVKHDLDKIGYRGACLLDDLMRGRGKSGGQIPFELISCEGVFPRQSTDYLAVSDALVKDVLEYLEEHFSDSLGVEQLSARFSVSRRTLEVRFRQALHMSIREFLIQLRLREGRRLLENTVKPVETIAAECGFCHASHFSTSFKKHFEVAPGRFRKLCR